MPSITVKNIPSDLYARLKQSAELNRRSINSEVIVCIERALESRPVDAEAGIARARLLREQMAGYYITDEEFDAAKAEGRP